MKYNRLGQTDLQVSQICLGTMTWGEQNTQAEAFAQMDYAIEQGVNFFDTAELYSIPPKAATYGATETIIGQWLKETGNRNEIILASKVCGPTDWCPHIRDGKAHLDRKNIIAACVASLQRLQTDYIDLYQTHWPDRSYEIGLAEISCREQMGLLAYSPLAFGTLSGKYLNGERPASARLTLFDSYTRYSGAICNKHHHRCDQHATTGGEYHKPRGGTFT